MLRKGFVHVMTKSLSLSFVFLVTSIHLLPAQTRDTQSCLPRCDDDAQSVAILSTPSRPSPVSTVTPTPFGLPTRPTETVTQFPTIVVTEVPGCPLPPDIEVQPGLDPSNCRVVGPLEIFTDAIVDQVNLLADLLEIPADSSELDTDEGLEEIERSTE